MISKYGKTNLVVILLITVLFLQVVFLVLVFLGKEITFDMATFASIFGSVLTIFGWWAVYHFGFKKSKKEIGIQQKMNIYERIINQNTEKVLESYYQIFALTMNETELQECNLRDEKDFRRKMLRDNSRQLMTAQKDFWKNFQVMNDLFQAWKPLFSKKVDYESKFLFEVAWVLYDEIGIYQRMLENIFLFYVNKDDKELNIEKKEIIKIESRISEKSDLFANAIDKFILDMSREVFEGLYKKEDEQRLFSLEIENLKEGDKFNILTEEGIKKKEYRKTEFQKKYGSILKK